MGKTLDKLLNVGKKLIVGTAIMALTMLPSKLKAQIHPSNYNPFNTPNITNTEMGAYGSGDVDRNDVIDWNDYSTMDTIQNDQADIDGDGVPSTANDKQELADYLNGQTSYLRGHWNKLQTREERVDWVDRLLAIDGISQEELDDQMPEAPCWQSSKYGQASQIKYFGWEKADTNHNDIPPLFGQPVNSIAENGKFNLPIFYASYGYPGFGHGFNAVLVGDNPLNFNDWQFIEPQGNELNDLKYRGENWNPPNGSTFEIGNATEFWDYLEMDCGKFYPANGENIVEFKLNEDTGESELTYYNPNLVLQRPTVSIENDNISKLEGYTLNQNYPNPFNSNTTISYTLPKDDNVSLKIFDLKGNELETLVNKKQNAGEHKINWNSSEYPSGTYFYRLQTSTTTKTKKMTYVK